MLIGSGYLVWLMLTVGILSITSVAALLAREVSQNNIVRPVVLSVEDRRTLEKMTSELKKRERHEMKRNKRRLAGEASDT
jgi:hypothetical protein